MIEPSGISLEIGRDGQGWFVYAGKQKLLHIRPTRFRHVFTRFSSMVVVPQPIGSGKYEHRDWINARYGGLKIDIGFGKWRRPIPRFWQKAFHPAMVAWWWGQKWIESEKYMYKEPTTNPWNSGNHWRVWLPRWLPALPYFFISLCYGAGKRQPGFYFGFKGYKLDWLSHAQGVYDTGRPWEWLVKLPYPKDWAWGDQDESENTYVGFSMSVRDDLVD